MDANELRESLGKLGSQISQLGDKVANSISNYELKCQMCDIGKRIWTLGFVAANDGNFSVKLPDGTFLATPTGTSKGFMTPDMIITLDKDGKVIDSPRGLKPSSEIKMHFKCYEERPDVNAVVHAHPPIATGYAIAHIPLDRYTMPEAILALGSVPIAPYGTPSTEEIPDSIVPFLPEHDVILLENHGALAVGADLMTAYFRMETLELYAKNSFIARMLGGEIELPQDKLEQLLALRSNYGVTGKHPGIKHYR